MKKRRASLALGILLVLGALFLIWAVSSRPQDDTINDPWLRDPPANLKPYQAIRVKPEDFRLVGPDNNRAANVLLKDRSFTALSDAELKTFAPTLSVKPGLKPYLVRAVSTGDPTGQCIVMTDAPNVLWMDCGILTRSPVNKLYHTPVIVLLRSAPKDVYITFSEAE